MNAETTTCTACKSLSRVGIKCNVHRTEAHGAGLIRRAREAGHVIEGETYAEQVLAAERALNARLVVIN